MGSTARPGSGPEAHDTGSWTTETLPFSVRKELLERELTSLGFRKKGAPAGGAQERSTQQQGGVHPQADADAAAHGD